MRRTSHAQGRRNIAWVLAFLEAKQAGQQVNLLSIGCKQLTLF